MSTPPSRSSSTGSGGGAKSDDNDVFGNSSLDHALLESLFYTEMMHMTDADSSVLSNQLLSSLTADGAVVHEATTAVPVETDPNIVAEKDLLNHFGVNDQQAPDGNDEFKAAEERVVAAAAHNAPTTSKISTARLQLASPERQVSSLTASLLPPNLAPQKVPPVGATATAATTTHRTFAAVAAPTTHSNPPPAASVAAAASMTEDDKRSKLVNQFATLASRLGINLPHNVLQSLTQVAGTRPTAASYSSSSSADMNDPAPPPPTVQQLAATAEAAVASVGRKRSHSESPPQQQQQQQGAATVPSSATSLAAAAAQNNPKRRKKPRLVECEDKLAQLKAENAMLKRHLANVSAASHQLEQDRQNQEARMRQMAAAGSTEEELDQAIQTFQDMYSDYGRRRHSEITFHLDQLLRLANPTNFTKMGLWTMGQQSKNTRNPIASILQKELGINSQQGRKILEQREKIRNVCDNMKETLRLLAQLKALCEQKTKIFHDRMTKCREILRPSQVVKCLTWIDQNSEILASLCPGWGSETYVQRFNPNF